MYRSLSASPSTLGKNFFSKNSKYYPEYRLKTPVMNILICLSLY